MSDVSMFIVIAKRATTLEPIKIGEYANESFAKDEADKAYSLIKALINADLARPLISVQVLKDGVVLHSYGSI